MAHQPDVDLDVATAPSDGFRDQLTDNERRIVDQALGNIGRIAQFVDQSAGNPWCEDRRVQTNPTSGGRGSGKRVEHRIESRCAKVDFVITDVWQRG
ncbi:MAG: hypothetical protein ACSLE3_07985 [Microbacteriaceae bacterium]